MPFFCHRFVTLEPMPPPRLSKDEFRPALEKFCGAIAEALDRKERTAIYHAAREITTTPSRK